MAAKTIKRTYWRDDRGTRLVSESVEKTARKPDVSLNRMVELTETDGGANLLSSYLKGVAE